MNGNQFGRDQRDYIRFRESRDFGLRERSWPTRKEDRQSTGRLPGPNRYGEENIHHDSYQDDQFKNDYDPTYQDEYGMKHPYEHGGNSNRWSDDIRSDSSKENHVGKGPKGYQRSDERIRDEACEILTRDWELDASDIDVDVEGKCIVLKGEVHSRHEKRLAESLVEDISGIEDVRNELKVKSTVNGWIPGLGRINEAKGGEPNEQG